MERQDLCYGEDVHTRFYEFRPFSEEVTTLRLGAQRRLIGLCVLNYRRCEPLCQRRGVAYIECARTPARLHYKGNNVHKVRGVTGNANIKYS